MWDFVLQSYLLYIAQHWHDHLNYHHAFLQNAYFPAVISKPENN